GAGGDVRITAANLEVANGAQLIAATFGRGDAGNVIIEVTETASFDGFNSLTGAPSAAFSGIGLNGAGTGGNVRITAANLEVVNGGQLIAAIFGQGDAGDVTIEVTETASFDGFNSLNDRTPSGAFSSIQPDGAGTGGDVRITAANLEVANGAQLNTATFGRGDAGDVIIEVTETASFDGFNSSNVAPSGALSSIQPGGEGDGGDVHITAANLEVTNGARLSASTFGWGDAGDVIIEVTETASFDGFNSLNGDASGARSSVAPDGEGDGGDVRITAANLEVANGAQLGGNSTGFGNAGNVILHIRERLLANDGTIATNATFASGGEIIINAGDICLEGDSDIQTFVNVGEGSGGDIVITADSVIAFDDSDILAFAQDGRGGDITLNTSAFFGENFHPNATVTDPEELDGNDRVDLNASGAVSGVISLPDVTFIENDLVELPERAVNPDVLVASSCVVRSQAQTGRFIITGSDSLPERPGEVTILPYSTGTIRPLPSEQSSDAGEALPWRRGEPIVESQGVYPLTDGRLVLSRECS
ncbi:MAG: hypothetical protein MJA27_17185, partial [Pseudanabaenales cyanobacterium]|nr:hypothetical protein [Pseudanabaenales cyanobacterium]